MAYKFGTNIKSEWVIEAFFLSKVHWICDIYTGTLTFIFQNK